MKLGKRCLYACAMLASAADRGKNGASFLQAAEWQNRNSGRHVDRALRRKSLKSGIEFRTRCKVTNDGFRGSP
jgi:hypothetical protein